MDHTVINSLGFSATTHNIKISVYPIFLAEESIPHNHYYLWAYHINIENNSDKIVQLQRRYWRITDGFGIVEEVSGEGVVGKQPSLQPQEHFSYTSGVSLTTPNGFMEGLFYFQTPQQQSLAVNIPLFYLSDPDEKPTYN